MQLHLFLALFLPATLTLSAPVLTRRAPSPIQENETPISEAQWLSYLGLGSLLKLAPKKNTSPSDGLTKNAAADGGSGTPYKNKAGPSPRESLAQNAAKARVPAEHTPFLQRAYTLGLAPLQHDMNTATNGMSREQAASYEACMKGHVSCFPQSSTPIAWPHRISHSIDPSHTHTLQKALVDANPRKKSSARPSSASGCQQASGRTCTVSQPEDGAADAARQLHGPLQDGGLERKSRSRRLGAFYGNGRRIYEHRGTKGRRRLLLLLRSSVVERGLQCQGYLPLLLGRRDPASGVQASPAGAQRAEPGGCGCGLGRAGVLLKEGLQRGVAGQLVPAFMRAESI